MSRAPDRKNLKPHDQTQLAVFEPFLRQAGPVSEARTEEGQERLRNLSPGVRAWALGETENIGRPSDTSPEKK